MNVRYFSFAAALFFASAANAQLPAPAPVQKDGDCPADYVADGSSCVPKAGAKFVISKTGMCPDGYDPDGNYCAAAPSARLAIRKAAMSCPSGYESTGNYCLSAK